MTFSARMSTTGLSDALPPPVLILREATHDEAMPTMNREVWPFSRAQTRHLWPSGEILML
jgi:hypothetical protein